MGNSSLSNEFKSGKWKTIQNIGTRQILQNIDTHIQVEKHFARSDFKSFDDRFKNTELYNWRKSMNQSVNLVKLYEFEIKQARFGIQEDQYVYTEKIHRFNQNDKLYSKAQGFLLILDFLMGLQILFQTFGLFNIDVFMLGISWQGKGKVWLNENYAINKVDEKNLIENRGQNSELTIINNLVRLVKDRVYNQSLVPEIQFPSNMYLKSAIQYISAVRKELILFRVDKVYLDRDQFQKHYDMLYAQHSESTQIRPEFHGQPLQHNYQNSPLLPIPNQQRIIERQKSSSFMKVKNQPSQTLSSDSNSRSKKPNDKLISPSTMVVNTQHQAKPHHEKIHLKEMIALKQANFNVNQQKIQQHGQFLQQEPVFIKNQSQNGRRGQTIVIRQRFNIPPMMHQPSQIPQIIRPSIQGNVGPQILQRQILFSGQYPQQFNQIPMIQRRIVEYRPVNQHSVYQQRSDQQIYRSPIEERQQFVPPAQNMYIHQEYRHVGHPMHQNVQHPVINRPVQRHNTGNPYVGIMRENSIFNPPSQNQNPFFVGVRNQEERFIDNVEICQSQVFDRAELQQNLADLQN